jgi:hypothetical protein
MPISRREKQREVAKAMEIRTFQGAMLLSPELRELVNCGAGAELVWRSDLGGTELCQVLSALSDHQQQKQLSGLRADLRVSKRCAPCTAAHVSPGLPSVEAGWSFVVVPADVMPAQRCLIYPWLMCVLAAAMCHRTSPKFARRSLTHYCLIAPSQ